jgi:hypothetical protein
MPSDKVVDPEYRINQDILFHFGQGSQMPLSGGIF